MRKLLLALAATLGLQAEIWTGYLMPQTCKNDEPRSHTRECLDRCASTGLGIVTSTGKFLPFDSRGMGAVNKLLKKSKRTQELRIVVKGELRQERIRIDWIRWDS
jgi:hypothetical protein